MMASRPSASRMAVRRCRRCAFMMSPEVGNDLAPEQVDGLLHLWHGVGHEEQAGERGDPRLLVDANALADLGRTADEVALLEAARLLAERGALERLQVLVELRAVKARDGLVVRAADRAGKLRRDVEARAVAPDLGRGLLHVVHAALDLLGREHGRHPAIAVLARPAPDLGVVAAGVHRQRRLPWLGEA